MYFTWPINIALDYNTAYNNFEYAWMRKKYFRIIRENGRIIAWIHADKMQPEFSKEIFMLFYVIKNVYKFAVIPRFT